MSSTDIKKGIPTERMEAKSSSEGGSTIVISTSKATTSEPEQTSDREDRAWKAYFAQTDAPLTSTLLTQVNGEDSNMASTLGFLYDYYGVTEDPNQPSSPGATPVSPSNQSNNSHTNNSDSEPSSPTHTESPLTYLHPVHQIKSQQSNNSKGASTSSDSGPILKSEAPRDKCAQGGQVIQHTKSLPSSQPSRAIVSQPISFPPGSSNSKSPASVSDVSSISLSQTPPEAYNFGPYAAAFKATPTVFSAQDKYTYVLEAPTSIIQRRGDDSLTYVNKGQFYAINFEGNVDPPVSEGDILRVKSVIHLVFRDEKDPRTELEHWHYWHSQQPNPQQRAFDVDRKSCQNIDENIDDLSYNAAGFVWSPHVNAKIVLRINCLSTDFSPQKGVKGIPLHLQIDTYEDPESSDAEPVHRAFCQIKVFRDKGAERKNKDESRSAERRMQKWMKQNPIGSESSMISPTHLFHPPSKFTQLLATTPLGPKPVLFTPVLGTPGNILPSGDPVIQTSSLLATIREREHKRTIQTALAVAKEELADLEVVPRMKVQRVHRLDRPAVTIYVKKDEEKVYNALMLKQLTVKELVNQIADKYNMPPDMIKSVYKKTKKGILVNMEDRMIEMFVDEDDFIINLDFDNQLGHFELTLRY
ncbi:grainyhead-like protein 2 homolog isoform X2 [Actinia tenebrosa]|uniref:Grainyhead-like protein 2 homolog isoform X2 n=1 Tax=Actinia tenebrosa TaxID=6105 RepID=A0A6P8I2C5_ACTTE|nr:grainyhead-like protein 2 homolog isoform X2 [Actinia tenebrosa]